MHKYNLEFISDKDILKNTVYKELTKEHSGILSSLYINSEE